MGVLKEEEEKKPVQQQSQMAMVTPRPVLTPEEQRQVQQFQQQERALMSQQRDAGMQAQAKQAGEKAFLAEFKRGVETVGLLIRNEKAAAQFPSVTEESVKDTIAAAQSKVPAYPRGIIAIASQRKTEIVARGAETANSIRTEYASKLQAILGPDYSDRIANLRGTTFNENIDQTLSPAQKDDIAKLNSWRSEAMSGLVAWREGEMKKVDDWKAQRLARPQGEIELDLLTSKVMDFYSLQGEDR